LEAFLIDNEWVSLARLSQLLDVKQSTIRSWMRRGTAPTFYKLGSLTRFRAVDIERWLVDNRNRLTDHEQEIADALSAGDDAERARRDDDIDASVV